MWLTPRQGHLRRVNIPDAEIWILFTNYTQLIDDAHHTAPVSDDYKPDFGSDNESDWLDNDADDENNEASHDAQNFNQIDNTNHKPPPHDTGHIKTGNPSPSDTCPYKCAIIRKNANGLGGRNEDKLEKSYRY